MKNVTDIDTAVGVLESEFEMFPVPPVGCLSLLDLGGIVRPGYDLALAVAELAEQYEDIDPRCAYVVIGQGAGGTVLIDVGQWFEDVGTACAATSPGAVVVDLEHEPDARAVYFRPALPDY